MELNGTIKLIRDTQSFGANNFRKRELVLVTNQEKYPQEILVEFTQDRCDVLDNYTEGQEVTIAYNIKGRMWLSPQGEEKYFVSIEGWKINATEGSNTQPQGSQPPPEPEDESDGLPF